MAVAQKQGDGSSPKIKRPGKPLKMKEKLFQKKYSGTSCKVPNKQAVNNMKECKSLKQKRATIDSVYDTLEAQSSVLERAKEVQANLEPEFPSLVKTMLPSHVTGGFWLGLPKHFCASHLPKHDITIVLEDENGEVYETKYLWGKVGLSGGWRGFSIAHKLLTGDVLVFHLVKPFKFKVYIVRSNGNGSDEVDGALALLKLDTCMMDFEKDNKACVKTLHEGLEPLLLCQENAQKKSPMLCDTNFGLISDHSENDSDFGSEILDGIRLSESVVDFVQIKSIDNFTVLVNGLVIDSELSKYLRTKYYELCCSQRSFLHDHLVKGLNCKLAAGIISETINIADAIRACKISSSQDDFSTWDKTLIAFEVLGMNVGFLRARLEQLVNISLKSKKYKEARLEHTHAEEEMRNLEAKLLEAKQKINSLDAEIETLDVNAEELELMFQEVAKAPW